MKKSKLTSQKILFGFLIALGIIYAINIFNTYSIMAGVNEKLREKEPAELFIVLVEGDCQNCFNMNNVVEVLKKNANVISEKRYHISSNEAKILIDRHGIDNLPALVITGEIDKPTISSFWDAISSQKNNGAVVIKDLPPYYSLSTGKTVGMVELVYIKDSSCAECYDVEINQQILPRFGMDPKNITSYDISSPKGKELIEKYNISKVPIILVSPDAAVYSSFVSSWDEVGSIEADGWFVMRNPEILGDYKELSAE